jgi:hypothetical protein
MYGLDFNHVDPKNSIPTRTLKVMLCQNLPQLQPMLRQRMEEVFARELHGIRAMAASNNGTSLLIRERIIPTVSRQTTASFSFPPFT